MKRRASCGVNAYGHRIPEVVRAEDNSESKATCGTRGEEHKRPLQLSTRRPARLLEQGQQLDITFGQKHATTEDAGEEAPVDVPAEDLA